MENLERPNKIRLRRLKKKAAWIREQAPKLEEIMFLPNKRIEVFQRCSEKRRHRVDQWARKLRIKVKAKYRVKYNAAYLRVRPRQHYVLAAILIPRKTKTIEE